MVTSIAVPVWLAQQIKAAGMTYSGALVAGWNAIEERRQANQKISDLQMQLKSTTERLQRYAERYALLMQEKEDRENANV